MEIKEPYLLFEKNNLEPTLTKTQIETHLVHHFKYYNNLRELIAKHKLESWSLEKILELSGGPLKNNAAQYWYHTLYWENLTDKKKAMGQKTLKLIADSEKSIENLKEEYLQLTTNHFSNGWYVLSYKEEPESKKKVLIARTYQDAVNPNLKEMKPILVIDLWEHAYYLDYKFDRKGYVDKIWDLINWEAVEKRIDEDYLKQF